MVTLEKFEAYLRVQESGRFNMLSEEAYKEANSICEMSREDYNLIIERYEDYCQMYLG